MEMESIPDENDQYIGHRTDYESEPRDEHVELPFHQQYLNDGNPATL